MQRFMLHSKTHRATVTQADLHYVGSLTIDRDLMDAADVLPGQQVDVVNIDNGQRLTTYAIEGERGTGIVCIDGAAARLVQPGDKIIVSAYATMDDTEARTLEPQVDFVDEANRIVDIDHDPGDVPTGYGLSTSAATHHDHPGAGPTGA